MKTFVGISWLLVGLFKSIIFGLLSYGSYQVGLYLGVTYPTITVLPIIFNIIAVLFGMYAVVAVLFALFGLAMSIIEAFE